MILLTFCYFLSKNCLFLLKKLLVSLEKLLISHQKLLAKLHFAQSLLLVAVVAADDALHLIYGVEDGTHRLIVGDALRVVALYDALQCVRSLYGLLLYDFVVLDDAEADVWSHHRQAVDFLVGEILVGHLDDALFANLLRRQVVADGNRSIHLLQLEQIHYLIGLFGWYMVDYGTVLDSRNH